MAREEYTPFWLIFLLGRRKYFPEIRIYRSDVINNSIYGNMRRIGVGKVQNHPWRPGDFAEMVILKNEAESGFRRPEKSAVFSDTRRSVRFLCLTFRSRDIAVLTSHRAEAGACTTSSCARFCTFRPRPCARCSSFSSGTSSAADFRT